MANGSTTRNTSIMKDQFDRQWIISNSLEELRKYNLGQITIRGLHYRLVSRGMTNSMRHYKRVVSAMIQARWDGLVRFEQFSDHDRDTLGRTMADESTVDQGVVTGKHAINYWLNNYSKNRWENQPLYVEVWIEKKALQGTFSRVCNRNEVLLAPCKGYPSLTFLNEAATRYAEYGEDKRVVILYFGDYDPSGEDIPRSIQENLDNMGVEVTVKRCMLLKDQVEEMGLPPAPAKTTDSRTRNASMKVQIELDAVEPNTLEQMCQEYIDEVFDPYLHERLLEQEEQEREEYREEMLTWVRNL